MPFRNREEVALKLAAKLSRHRGKNPLVLAIPRGAVPMGKHIAEKLEGELDVVLVRKLGAPGNPEYAIGAVDETGRVQVNEEAGFAPDDPYVKEEVERQIETMRERRKRYSPVHSPIDPKERIVIVVDDGIATGSTMLTALKAIRARKPKRLIAAIGVAPKESLRAIEKEADEVVCLETPKLFFAVGQFFQEFPQVTDEEVVELLTK